MNECSRARSPRRSLGKSVDGPPACAGGYPRVTLDSHRIFKFQASSIKYHFSFFFFFFLLRRGNFLLEFARLSGSPSDFCGTDGSRKRGNGSERLFVPHGEAKADSRRRFGIGRARALWHSTAEEDIVASTEDIPQDIGVRDLLEAGLHFGHQTKRWNPKMKRFIFDKRNGIHIIDLAKSLDMLKEASQFVHDVVASGKKILFVGTKKQAQQVIEEAALTCGQYYVTNRWLGGTLTNSKTIRRSIKKMREVEDLEKSDAFASMHKKEAASLRRELQKLRRNLSGIAGMSELPGAVFVVDINREAIAVAEANKLDIPVIAMVDTNCDPDPVRYLIPSNDDAIRAIKLVAGVIAETIRTASEEYAKIAAEIARRKEAEAEAKKAEVAAKRAEAEAKREKAKQKKQAGEAKSKPSEQAEGGEKLPEKDAVAKGSASGGAKTSGKKKTDGKKQDEAATGRKKSAAADKESSSTTPDVKKIEDSEEPKEAAQEESGKVEKKTDGQENQGGD